MKQQSRRGLLKNAAIAAAAVGSSAVLSETASAKTPNLEKKSKIKTNLSSTFRRHLHSTLQWILCPR